MLRRLGTHGSLTRRAWHPRQLGALKWGVRCAPCSAATAGGAALQESQKALLEQYVSLVMAGNKVMNLTAVRNKEDAWARHVEDSLSLLPIVEGKMPSQHALRVIDVGTGAGIPGVIWAIARPQWRVLLLDATRKRVDFLTRVKGELGLGNVDVLWSRAEDAGQDAQLREAFDVAVARAVAEVRVLAELCLPLVRRGGLWVAAKGPNPQEEVQRGANAIKRCGGKLDCIESVESFSSGGQRTAVIVHKVRPTPATLPRPSWSGQLQKKPL